MTLVRRRSTTLRIELDALLRDQSIHAGSSLSIFRYASFHGMANESLTFFTSSLVRPLAEPQDHFPALVQLTSFLSTADLASRCQAPRAVTSRTSYLARAFADADWARGGTAVWETH